MKLRNIGAAAVGLSGLVDNVDAARQPYDVRKIIDAFRVPRDDLTILCAHRGLRWNGTADNSRDAYFRASQAGIECIETDIRLSADGYLIMLHDAGLGRETDVGEQSGKLAYNPYTGHGYNPAIIKSNYSGFIENLHYRDEQGRAHFETIATLEDVVSTIQEAATNVVLQLDFKEKAAVEQAYWRLKALTNHAGIPANEWCIYKVQASWWRTPEEFEAQAWVRDAFASGVRLAHIPVYQPSDEADFDTIASVEAFGRTNYTISAEIEMRSNKGPLSSLLGLVQSADGSDGNTISTAGIFYAIGDFVKPVSNLTNFDTANYTLPDDIRVNNTVYVFQDDRAPVLLDSLVGEDSHDGHDYRSDLHWIFSQDYNWVIADAPDILAALLEQEGKRNITYMLEDGRSAKDRTSNGWYRRHVRGFTANA